MNWLYHLRTSAESLRARTSEQGERSHSAAPSGKAAERNNNFHESYARDEGPIGGSNKNFGLVFAGFFALVTAAKFWHESPWAWFTLALSAGFLAVTYLLPQLLSPLNRGWTKLGLLLYTVMNPLILGILFYVCITPMGLIMRVLGKDLLRKRFDANADSYWIVRTPPGPAPESMRRQF